MASDSPDLAFIDVTFLAIGDDERIHQLNKLTKRRLNGGKRFVGDYYCIGLKLGQANEERKAVRIASTFLQKHRELFKSLYARKVIELNTCFGPGDGSRILTLEATFCQLCFSIDCAFRHQTSQWLGARPARVRSD